MKKIIFSLTLVLYFASVISLFGLPQTHAYSSGNMNWLNGNPSMNKAKYLTVQTFCSKSACTLHCSDPNPNGDDCNWGSSTWCEGCIGFQGVWNSSNADEMYDYALDKIENNDLSGQYSLHYINT